MGLGSPDFAFEMGRKPVYGPSSSVQNASYVGSAVRIGDGINPTVSLVLKLGAIVGDTPVILEESDSISGTYTACSAVGVPGNIIDKQSVGTGAVAGGLVTGLALNRNLFQGGYVSAPAVTFLGGAGSGAAATATIDADGNLTGITLTAAGTGYTSAPTVQVDNPPGFFIKQFFKSKLYVRPTVSAGVSNTVVVEYGYIAYKIQSQNSAPIL